ncbi:hypothetical protein ACFSQU_01090 [Massilia sp. GCM10020059]|uniref:Lipoprotein n=1 Tax=Massilia agrisoli TaxID=2892444 RepID=A0ABS8IS74_9BURK|nr:hypothetical protein [Massilia agrisoli]MCC6070677.1 hypothetical protein [Massilia agrisoli]
MDTRLSISRSLSLLALAATLAACAETTPRWDSTFGNSVRSTFAAQVINPAAVRNSNPVVGVDGRAAMAAQKKYESGEGAQEPASPPTPMMIGSASK